MAGKSVDRLLQQISKVKSEQRTFEVYNKKFMKITSKSLIEEKIYHINLSMLEPWPIRHRQLSWRWMVSIGSFLIASIISTVLLFSHKSDGFGGLITIITALSIIFTLASTLRFLYCSPNVMQFRSRYGGIVLVSLLFNNPNRKEFASFVEELKNRILMATSSMKVPREQMLSIELKELRRLASESIFSDEEYAQAKSRIFALHQ